MIYLELIWSFMQVGICSIGGGYASLPLIQQQVVELHSWITMTEFTDVLTISQMTPGPIAINAATFVGMRIAGIPGAIAATLGCVLPSCVIVVILAYIYYKYRSLQAIAGALSGVRPAVVALIASASVSIALLALYPAERIDWIAVGIFAVGLFVLRKWKPSPIVIIAASGIIGGALYGLLGA